MNRILLVKTSSMGDVVHNLPVASDLAAAFPDCRIDWVVEHAFSAIPALHPAISSVIPVSIRRWRRHPLAADTRREVSALRAQFKSVRYDAVIDTQGLLKSAVISRMADGYRHGLDWKSSREPLALFYDEVHAVPWTMHAVQRNRTLACKALGFSPREDVRYGIAPSIDATAAIAAFLEAQRLESYAVLLHATSAASKEWPEERWTALGKALAAKGMASVLPFGNDVEAQRSVRLAARIPGAVVPPAQELGALSGLLGRARVVFGVDTGLSHLAVALGIPTIGLYVATSPAATGLFGSPVAVNVGDAGKPPTVDDALIAAQPLLEQA